MRYLILGLRVETRVSIDWVGDPNNSNRIHNPIGLLEFFFFLIIYKNSTYPSDAGKDL